MRAMVTTKATKATPAKAAKRKAAPERQQSRLAEIGEAAMRKALLASLNKHDWQLSQVAVDMRLSGSANVIRSIRQLNLTDAYEAARARGAVKPGPRPA
jgi:hypothetical protein